MSLLWYSDHVSGVWVGRVYEMEWKDHLTEDK